MSKCFDSGFLRPMPDAKPLKPVLTPPYAAVHSSYGADLLGKTGTYMNYGFLVGQYAVSVSAYYNNLSIMTPKADRTGYNIISSISLNTLFASGYSINQVFLEPNLKWLFINGGTTNNFFSMFINPLTGQVIDRISTSLNIGMMAWCYFCDTEGCAYIYDPNVNPSYIKRDVLGKTNIWAGSTGYTGLSYSSNSGTNISFYPGSNYIYFNQQGWLMILDKATGAAVQTGASTKWFEGTTTPVGSLYSDGISAWSVGANAGYISKVKVSDGSLIWQAAPTYTLISMVFADPIKNLLWTDCYVKDPNNYYRGKALIALDMDTGTQKQVVPLPCSSGGGMAADVGSSFSVGQSLNQMYLHKNLMNNNVWNFSLGYALWLLVKS